MTTNLSGKAVPAVFIPRFTSLNGTQTFKTTPINAAPYTGALVTGWRGELIGSSASFNLSFWESTDRVTWSQCGGSGGGDPGAGQEDQWAIAFTKRWFRMHVDVAGNNAGVSLWAQALLIRRES